MGVFVLLAAGLIVSAARARESRRRAKSCVPAGSCTILVWLAYRPATCAQAQHGGKRRPAATRRSRASCEGGPIDAASRWALRRRT